MLFVYGSPYKMLEALFPELGLHPWLFRQIPKGYWDSADHRLKYLTWLGKKLQFVSLKDWYRVKTKDFHSTGGRKLLKDFNGSMFSLLAEAFPDFSWVEWKFEAKSHSFWDDIDLQRRYMDWLKAMLRVQSENDWYKLSVSILSSNFGKQLAAKYDDDLCALLSAVYTETEWIPWRFKKVKKGFWDDEKNHRLFADWLFKELRFSKMEDWYNINQKTIVAHNGSGLLARYSKSPSLFVKKMYPDHAWDDFRFGKGSSFYWKDESQLEAFMDLAKEKLKIESLDDWYRVSRTQIKSLRGGTLISENGGLVAVLERLYPDHSWNISKFKSKSKKSSQRLLWVRVRGLYPLEEVIEDYRHPEMKFAGSDIPMELDIFIPSLQLAFEYHGLHHYQDVMIFGVSRIYRARDEEKRKLCLKAGITLVEIPYWWDGTSDTLAATVDSLLATKEAQQTSPNPLSPSDVDEL